MRARGNDVLMLAQFFVDRFSEQMGVTVSGVVADVAEKLLDYPWPGNVRELENCIERAVVMAQNDHITLPDLPPKVRKASPRRVVLAVTDTTSTLLPLHEVERQYCACWICLVATRP